MNAQLKSTTMKPAASTGCGCGCGGGCGCNGGCGGTCACQSRCCELECLVRPNFFCGQLLTDADLATMVEWTRKRFALARYRDGWGVACGLDLTCRAPNGAAACCTSTSNGLAVYLSPGYAIDCCGNDLVVCEPLRIDLTSVCVPPDDPCSPTTKPSVPPAPQQPVGGGNIAAIANTAPRDCFSLDGADLVTVQVKLRYHEDLAQGQRAMFRGACSDSASCEYARVLEQPCVHLEVVAKGDQDARSDLERWEDDLRTRMARQLATLRVVLTGGPDSVMQYLKRYPPYQYCYIEDVACCLRERSGKGRLDQTSIKLGMYIYVDWLMRELQCGCLGCRPDDGVPLGAVVLRREMVGRNAQCKVVAIDQKLSHRRPLRRDTCRPLTGRETDLLRYLGWTPDDMQADLGDTSRGFADSGEATKLEALDARQQMFRFDQAMKDKPRALTVVDPFGHPRIVAFVKG